MKMSDDLKQAVLRVDLQETTDADLKAASNTSA
jgi:hypothetical protein